MRQRLKNSTKQTQRFSPKQVQLSELLELDNQSLEERVAEELEGNPALEQAQSPMEAEQLLSILRPNEPFQTRITYRPEHESLREKEVSETLSLHEQLMEQLQLLSLPPLEHAIAEQIVGSIDSEGFLSGTLNDIALAMATTYDLPVPLETISAVLQKIQSLDPPGIAARSLEEALLIQLRRKSPSDARDMAIKLVEKHLPSLNKKDMANLSKSFSQDEHPLLKEALNLFSTLSTKPGLVGEEGRKSPVLKTDFFVSVSNGELAVTPEHDYLPTLRVSSGYASLLQQPGEGDATEMLQARQFVQEKIERARWFIESIQQRQRTLSKIVDAIVQIQAEFFTSEDDPNLLVPLSMKQVAQQVGIDTSTVSRAVRSKGLRTYWGAYPLKYFFAGGIQTEAGEATSNKHLEGELLEIVARENKDEPLSDQLLMEALQARGICIARRTVAKYRTKLKIPPAHLRKPLFPVHGT